MRNCNQCGKCCINYSYGGLSATDEEIENWKHHRPEVYKYVHQGLIWFSPESGQQLDLCPWLIPSSLNSQTKVKYSCSIYQDRPADCRHYQVTISQMKADECEMLEPADLLRPKIAKRKLDRMMIDSRVID